MGKNIGEEESRESIEPKGQITPSQKVAKTRKETKGNIMKEEEFQDNALLQTLRSTTQMAIHLPEVDWKKILAKKKQKEQSSQKDK